MNNNPNSPAYLNSPNGWPSATTHPQYSQFAHASPHFYSGVPPPPSPSFTASLNDHPPPHPQPHHPPQPPPPQRPQTKTPITPAPSIYSSTRTDSDSDGAGSAPLVALEPKQPSSSSSTNAAASAAEAFARLEKCIPPDAFSPSEKAQFFANITILYPTQLPHLHLATSSSTTSTGEKYHHVSLLSLSTNSIAILVESGKFRGRRQDMMGAAKTAEDGKGEVSFEGKLVRSLFCAVEDEVEGMLVGVRNEARGGGEGRRYGRERGGKRETGGRYERVRVDDE